MGASASLGCSGAEAWDEPQRANNSQHETRSKNEGEIEYASFQNQSFIVLIAHFGLSRASFR